MIFAIFYWLGITFKLIDIVNKYIIIYLLVSYIFYNNNARIISKPAALRGTIENIALKIFFKVISAIGSWFL